MAKKEHAEELRRRIATYRRQLAEGVPADTARTYLTEIGKAEAELAKIEQDGDKRRSSIESSSQDVDARVGPGPPREHARPSVRIHKLWPILRAFIVFSLTS